MKPRKVVLLVDSDIEVSETLNDILLTKGYEVISAQNSEEGLEILKNTIPDLLILDLQTDKKQSDSLLSEKLKSAKIPVLIHTEHSVLTTSENAEEVAMLLRKDPSYIDNSLLLLKGKDGSAGIDFRTSNDNKSWKSVDAIIRKSAHPEQLFSEINRLLE